MVCRPDTRLQRESRGRKHETQGREASKLKLLSLRKTEESRLFALVSRDRQDQMQPITGQVLHSSKRQTMLNCVQSNNDRHLDK